MRNGLVVALLLLAQSASASPVSRGIDPAAGRVNRPPVALAGDPDSPMDMVRPLAVFSTGIGRLRLVMPMRAEVSVTLFGINGRKVGSRDLGVLEAGSHEVGDAGLERAPAGIYFARVRAGDQYVRSKIIKIR